MGKIDIRRYRYVVMFKRKDLRPNKRDDKFEIFRHAIGLEDTKDIFDLNHYVGHHATTEIRKEKTTITDINTYESPFITARLTEEQYIRIKKDPNVESVTFDTVWYPPPMVQFVGWNHRFVRSRQANNANTYGITGRGVNVAWLDSGSDGVHPDIAANIKMRQNFTDDGAGPGPSPEAGPAGFSDHGQKAAGMICMIDNDIGSVGYAPESNVWALRIYFLHPTADVVTWSFADGLEAMTFSYNNNAHVVGCNVQGPRVAGQITQLNAVTKPAFDTKGILTTSANGNQNRSSFPGEGVAGAYGVYGICALNRLNKKASYSNFGPDTDFCNPAGEFGPTDIIEMTTGLNGSYGSFNGTSAATPGMTGCCAVAVAAWKPGQCPPYDPAVGKAQTLTTALAMSCTQPEGHPRMEKNDIYGYGYPELDRLCALLRGETLA